MRRIGEDVERELARSGHGEGATLARITASWPDAVGPAIARHAWPLRLARNGTLHVAASSATWAFELDRLSPEILERLTRLVGAEAPAELRFRPGPIPEPATGGVEQCSQAPREPSPQVAAEAAAAASAIEDPELRRLAERAARASLVDGRFGRAF